MTFGPNRGLCAYVRCASSRVATVILNFQFSHTSVLQQIKHLSMLRGVDINLLGKIQSQQLYKPLLMPVIDYGDAIYDVASKNPLGKVQRIASPAYHIIQPAYKSPHLSYLS